MIDILVYVKDDCGPSQQLKAFIKKNELTHYKVVNVESFPLQAMQDNVRATPTSIVKDGDKILAVFVGFSKTIKEEVEGVNDRLQRINVSS